MSKSLGGIRNDHGRRPGFSPIRGTNPQETTPSNAGNTHNTLAQVPGTTNSQSGDRESGGQSSVTEAPINLNPSPSSSPRTQENLSVAEAAFAMELDVQGQGGGKYYVLNFCDKNSSEGRGGNI